MIQAIKRNLYKEAILEVCLKDLQTTNNLLIISIELKAKIIILKAHQFGNDYKY